MYYQTDEVPQRFFKETIMNARNLVAMTAALTVSTVAFAADDGEALFKKHNCAACHTVANKSVGPSLKDIAAKYKADKGAQARLETKVRSGGKDSFGAMPMPATAKTVSDGDIKTMVAWILRQK
jgi:cytochrome c